MTDKEKKTRRLYKGKLDIIFKAVTDGSIVLLNEWENVFISDMSIKFGKYEEFVPSFKQCRIINNIFEKVF